MPSMLSNSLLALASATSVAAHGFVKGVSIDGVYQTGWLVDYAYNPTPPESFGWSETALDLGFVSPAALADPDIICHLGAKNGALSATVAAGTTMEVFWSGWPDSHKGPVIDYLASCKGDCATVDKTTLEFFKIDEKGLEAGSWASDELMNNNASWAVTIPSTIAPGNYVLRHEIIALHGAGSVNGAQLYPFCLNLEVTGGGSDVPAGTLGTALYKEDDPGILVNIYVNGLDYVIPGPALYGSGSGSGSGSGNTTTPVATSAAAPVATSSALPVATSAAGNSTVPIATSVAPSAVPTTLATAIATSAPVATSAPEPEAEDDC
ncbi:putative endoglucanase-4 [Cadophora sp. MPI-SDFR-AT-0126]|nr:putative endoglucanase-4 [Leotiomycetes sp. MPI-SDFR-AT-0126]